MHPGVFAGAVLAGATEERRAKSAVDSGDSL